jgi:hypothetical protein
MGAARRGGGRDVHRVALPDGVPDAKLDEYDKWEWFDVCRKVYPGLPRDVYEAMWEEFVRQKALRKMQ